MRSQTQRPMTDLESQVPAPLTPKFMGGLFAPFRRESRATTSLTGQVTEPDTEPPLMRYAIEKPRSASASFYNLVRLQTRSLPGASIASSVQTPTDESLGALGFSLPPPPSNRAKFDAFPRVPSPALSQSLQTPTLSLPLQAAKVTTGTLAEPPSPASKVSHESRDVSDMAGRLSSEAPTIRTTASTIYVNYPVTSMPMPVVPVARVPTIRKVDGSSDLKLTIPEKRSSRVMQIDPSPDIIPDEIVNRVDSSRRDKSRTGSPASSVSSQGKRLPALPDGRKSIIFPPVSKERRTRSKLSIDVTAPLSSTPPPSFKDLERFPPSTPPPAPPSKPPKVIKRRPSPKDRIPSSLYKRLSQDLASLVDPETPPDRQSALYKGMLTILSEVMEPKAEKEPGMPMEDLLVPESQRFYLGAFPVEPEDPKHGSVSTATMTPIPSMAHSKFFPEEALSVLRSILPDQASHVNTLSSLLEMEQFPAGIPSAGPSVSGETETYLTERLNKKLHELDDADSTFEVEAIVNPMKPRKLSQSSLEILESLEEEFEDVRIQLDARPNSDTFSSSSLSYVDESPRDGEKTTPQTSPVWRPSAEIVAAARKIPLPTFSPISRETSVYDSPDRSSIVSMTLTPREMYSRSRSESRAGLWSPISPIEEEQGSGLWRTGSVNATTKREHREINFNVGDKLPRLSSISRRNVEPEVEPPSSHRLWRPTPLDKPSLWRPKRAATISKAMEDAGRVGLWKPPRRSNSDGLWMSSIHKRNSIRIHREWQYSDSIGYPRRIRMDDFLPMPDFNGLWRRSTSKRNTIDDGLWKSNRQSKFAEQNSMLPSLPFRLSSFADEISFVIDSRSSVYSLASDVPSSPNSRLTL